MLCCQAVIVTTTHNHLIIAEGSCSLAVEALHSLPKDHLSFSFWSFSRKEKGRDDIVANRVYEEHKII